MRAFITGVLGFCARHLAQRLREGGHTVGGSDLLKPLSDIQWLDAYFEADVCDSAQFRAVISRFKPDWVFHLAGLARGSERTIYRTNVEGTRCVLNVVHAEASHASLLLVGSAAEYGRVDPANLPVDESHPCRPSGAYATSKHEAVRVGLEFAVRTGMRVVVARPFNIVGPGISEDLVVGALIARLKTAERSADEAAVVRIGNLDSARDFIAIDDVVRAYLLMIEGGGWGEVFNVCSGQFRTIREVADTLRLMARKPIRFEVDPALMRKDDVPVIFGTGAKALATFGFRPDVPLEESLAAAWRDS